MNILRSRQSRIVLPVSAGLLATSAFFAPGKAMAAAPQAKVTFEFIGQSSDEGLFTNALNVSLENTGTVPIFAIFIWPHFPFRSNGSTDPDGDDLWTGWSSAIYRPDGSHTWDRLNSLDYIVELDDVPNTVNWDNTYALGVYWNKSHNPATHETVSPLAPGAMLERFSTYYVAGFPAGDSSVEFPATIMLAGTENGSVVTSVMTWPPPADSDEDGMSNAFETQYPTASEPDIDTDGDGKSNLEEFRAGTIPTDSQSRFQVTDISRDGNDVQIVFHAIAGKRYRVGATTTLSDDFPIHIETLPPLGEDGIRIVTDQGGAGEPRLFYRVEVLP
jgi:hypothetical protein